MELRPVYELNKKNNKTKSAVNVEFVPSPKIDSLKINHKLEMVPEAYNLRNYKIGGGGLQNSKSALMTGR